MVDHVSHIAVSIPFSGELRYVVIFVATDTN